MRTALRAGKGVMAQSSAPHSNVYPHRAAPSSLRHMRCVCALPRGQGKGQMLGRVVSHIWTFIGSSEFNGERVNICLSTQSRQEPVSCQGALLWPCGPVCGLLARHPAAPAACWHGGTPRGGRAASQAISGAKLKWEMICIFFSYFCRQQRYFCTAVFFISATQWGLRRFALKLFSHCWLAS